jgi:hypothetical protein
VHLGLACFCHKESKKKTEALKKNFFLMEENVRKIVSKHLKPYAFYHVISEQGVVNLDLLLPHGVKNNSKLFADNISSYSHSRASLDTFDSLKDTDNALVIAIPKLSRKTNKITLLGQSVIRKCTELQNTHDILLLVKRDVSDVISQQTGIFSVIYDIEHGWRALFCCRKKLSLISLHQPYNPEEPELDELCVSYYTYVPEIIDLHHDASSTNVLPILCKMDKYELYTQPEWHIHMIAAGRMVVQLAAMETTGQSESTTVFLDVALANSDCTASVTKPFRDRLESVLAHIGAVFVSLSSCAYADQIAAKYAMKIMPWLADPVYLASTPDYYQIVRAISTWDPQIIFLENNRFQIVDKKKIFECRGGHDMDVCRNIACKNLVAELGGAAGIRARLKNRQEIDFLGSEKHLMHLAFVYDGSLITGHVAFYVKNNIVHSASLSASKPLCLFTDLKRVIC